MGSNNFRRGLNVKKTRILSLVFVWLLLSARSGYAEPVNFLCIGELPIYVEHWSLLSNGKDSALIITIDKDRHAISADLPMTSFTSASLHETDNYYTGSAQMNRKFWGNTIRKVSFQIDRYSHRTTIAYYADSGGNGYSAFDGTCTLAKEKY
jgi:hypothetical protein